MNLLKTAVVTLTVILVGICCQKLHAQGNSVNMANSVYHTNVTVTGTSGIVLTANVNRAWVHITNSGTNNATIGYGTNAVVYGAGDWLPASGGFLNLSPSTDIFLGNIIGITASTNAGASTTLGITEGRR